MEVIGILGFFVTLAGIACVESTMKILIIGLCMMGFSYLICTITDKVMDMDKKNYEKENNL